MTCAKHTNSLFEHMYQLIRLAIKRGALEILHLICEYRVYLKSITHTNAPRNEIVLKLNGNVGYLLRDSKVVAISSVQMAQLICKSFDKFSLELTLWSELLLRVLT